jgi:hypothetical protein
MADAKRPGLLGYRPTNEERRMLVWLGKKLGGLKMTQVVKLAIRRLYDAEKK